MKLLKKRIFVGNLPSQITESEVERKLRGYGKILSVELKQRKDLEGNKLSSFAFVNIETDSNNLDLCFQHFESELWSNRKVKLELAKESFLERLKRERETAKSRKSLSSCDSTQTTCHNNKEKESQKKGADYVDDECSSQESVIYSKNDFDETVEPSAKKRIRVKAKSNEDSSHSTEISSICEDTSSKDQMPEFKITEKLPCTNINENNEDACQRNGSLPMFTGTKSLIDIDSDSFNNNNNATSLSSKGNSDDVYSMSTKSDCDAAITSQDLECSSVKISDHLRTRGIKRKVSAVNVSDDTASERTDKRADYLTFSVEKRHANVVKDEISVTTEHVPENSVVLSVKDKKRKPDSNKIDESKRRNALEERKNLLSMQKLAVKQALSSVDMKSTSNKKILFDVDEDNEEPVVIQRGNENHQYKSNDDPKPKLFEDSSDDEDLKDIESRDFKIKPQFEGQQGRKLLEMQSRFGNDSRFNLDERFLESEEEIQPGENEENEENLIAEKDHQLSILQGMLGVDVTTKPVKKDKTEKRKDCEMVRFDPTNPKHSKYIVKEDNVETKTSEKEKSKKEKKKKKDEEMSKEEEKPLPTSIDRFYVVSDSLKDVFKKRNEKAGTENDQIDSAKGFSLLKTYGSTHSDSEKEEVSEEYTSKTIEKKTYSWEKNPFKYDSSDDEEEPQNNVEIKATKTSLGNQIKDFVEKNKNLSSNVTETFHFKDDDCRFKEGLEFFKVEKSFEEMQEGFQEKRADLKMIIKAKIRNNKKKKLPFRRKLGGIRGFQRNFKPKARK